MRWKEYFASQEWRRRRKDRIERPPAMQTLWEEAERNKATDLLIQFRQQIVYDKWKYNFVLFKVLSRSVKQRLGAIQIANPRLACQIEEFIVELYMKRKIDFVDFDSFKKIVEHVLSKRAESE